MANFKTLLNRSILAVVLVFSLTVSCAYASLGELGMESRVAVSKIADECDFSDFPTDYANTKQVLSENGASDTYIGLSKYTGKYYNHFNRKYDSGTQNTYVSFNVGLLKFKDFFRDVAPGKIKISFKAKCVSANKESVECPLYMQVFDLPSSVEQQKTITYTSKHNICTTSDTDDWIETSVEFDYAGNCVDLGDNYDSYALLLRFSAQGPPWDVYYAIDDIEVECAKYQSVSVFANSEITLDTDVYNNTDEDKDATIVTALFDSKDDIKYLDQMTMSVGALGYEPYSRQIAIPEDADDTWKLKVFLRTDDDMAIPYCDEFALFSSFNLNTGFENLDADSSTGIRNWQMIENYALPTLSTDSYGGKYSISLDAETKGAVQQNIKNMITDFGAGRYEVTFAAKAEGTGSVKLVLDAQTQQVFNLTSSWKEISWEVDMASTVSALSVYNNGNSNICIDDVIIKRIN